MTKKIALLGFAISALSVLAFFAGVLTFRTSALSFGTAFTFIKIAIPASLAGSSLSLFIAAYMLARKIKIGISYALLGAFLGLCLALPMLRLKGVVDRLPKIHDITTNTAAPPQFVAILPLRKDAPNSVTYEGPMIADQQKKAYPDIRPKLLEKNPPEAIEFLTAKVRELGWEIVKVDKEALRIEATVTSALFAFKDDVVIEIRPFPNGCRVDARSVSRVGLSDLGKNAEHLRKLFATFPGQS